VSELIYTATNTYLANEEQARRHYAQLTFNTAGECVSLNPESPTLLEDLLAVGYAVYVEPEPVPPTPEQIISELVQAAQDLLDTVARSRNYDGILSLCSYATSKHIKFGPEGIAGVVWRDAVWAKGYDVMAEVQAGQRGIPTTLEFLALMPLMTWPDVMVTAITDGVITEEEDMTFAGVLWNNLKSFFSAI